MSIQRSNKFDGDELTSAGAGQAYENLDFGIFLLFLQIYNSSDHNDDVINKEWIRRKVGQQVSQAGRPVSLTSISRSFPGPPSQMRVTFDT